MALLIFYLVLLSIGLLLLVLAYVHDEQEFAITIAFVLGMLTRTIIRMVWL